MPSPMRKIRIPRGRCQTTGKLMFSHSAAQGALSDARKSSKSYRRECRIYQCPDCGSWHLTSRESWPDR